MAIHLYLEESDLSLCLPEPCFWGILCAWYENRLADRILCKLGTISSCIPEFWMALVLILVFSVNLKILPSSGAYSTGNAGDIGDRVLHLIMPLTIVVMEHLWYYAYMIRNKILEESPCRLRASG